VITMDIESRRARPFAINPESQAFYRRKRAEGKRHTQAVIALARRRVNVPWALLRDNRPYETAPPTATAA
jgi:hypothetical protein